LKKKDYPRDYRQSYNKDLYNYSVVIDESDLYIRSDKSIVTKAYMLTQKYRYEIIDYIFRNPNFEETLSSYPITEGMPPIVSAMAKASVAVNVGPMASVAGAIAEYVARDLLKECNEIIIENGGDIFMKTIKPRTVGTFAGESMFSNSVFFSVDPSNTPLGICTSSGTVGHSLSFGKADAVTAISHSASLADAAATAICNKIKTPHDIEKALEYAKEISGLIGVVALMGDEVGIWGRLKLKRKENDNTLYFNIY